MGKTTWIRVISLALVLVLLLTGCSWRISPKLPMEAETSEQTETVETTKPELILPDDFDPLDYPDAVAFSQIEYERPNVESLISRINDVTSFIKSDATAEEVLDALYELDPYCADFTTMDSVAYIYYCINLSDTFFKDEYDYLENQAPLIEKALELLYEAAADSPYKAELEDEYFGEGFLDYYLTHDIYKNDEFVALAQKEAALQSQYMQLQDNQSITIDGEEYLLNDLMEEYEDDIYKLYYEIYPEYFKKYNQSMGEIYVQLVQTRQKMAQTVGYETYADFAYEYLYSRDYSPEMARTYIGDICDELAPLYMDLQMNGSMSMLDYNDMDFQTVIENVEKSLYLIDCEADSDFYEYFSFMKHFGLWDATESSGKMSGSYETYLPSYAEPFVYISPTGTESDFLTLSHEFGHFSDSMINDNEDSVLDKCEIFSQGMEALVLFYNDLDEDVAEKLKKLQLSEMLEVFVYQGMYADFEDRVYQLDLDTLTVDIINETYSDVVRDYGMYYAGMDWYNEQVWIDINHFFIAPYYVISYCTSADAALQIFAKEDEHSGAGAEVYCQLIDRADELEFLELLKAADLESPFDNLRIWELSCFFRDYLD